MMQPEDKTQEIAERAERLQEIGSSILRAARDELYLGMRFLDVALSSFSYQMDGSIHGFGTDGRVIYFQPQMLGGLYKENRIEKITISQLTKEAKVYRGTFYYYYTDIFRIITNTSDSDYRKIEKTGKLI